MMIYLYFTWKISYKFIIISINM